jgi:biotin carboxyl carrier protein
MVTLDPALRAHAVAARGFMPETEGDALYEAATLASRAVPGAPFVEVGSSIKKGDTVCIIEAMKLFNEIESEVSGTIVKVLVNDSTPIEYDQPLFLVEPA